MTVANIYEGLYFIKIDLAHINLIKNYFKP